MTSQDKPPTEDAEEIKRALERAARRARELAERTGTPCCVARDGAHTQPDAGDAQCPGFYTRSRPSRGGLAQPVMAHPSIVVMADKTIPSAVRLAVVSGVLVKYSLSRRIENRFPAARRMGWVRYVARRVFPGNANIGSLGTTLSLCVL